jgi:hypothetical protein
MYRFDILYQCRPQSNKDFFHSGSPMHQAHTFYSDNEELEVREINAHVSETITGVDHLLVVAVNGQPTAGCLAHCDRHYFVGKDITTEPNDGPPWSVKKSGQCEAGGER